MKIKQSIKLRKIRFNSYLKGFKREDQTQVTNDIPSVIVSLTSYSARFKNLDLCLRTLLNQKYPIDSVVLWISHEDKSKLPKRVLKLVKHGLDIRYCDDIRSYKKLIFSLEEFKNEIIVTTDDDQLYPSSLIDSLVQSYLEDNKAIHCTAARMMTYDLNGELHKYRYWPNIPKNIKESSLQIMPIGYGGVLYPPGALSSEVFNRDVYMDICKHGDDIWFKAMSALNGIKCNKIITKNRLQELTYDNDEPLFVANQLMGRNDTQVEAVFKKYNIVEKLRERK